MKHVFALTLLAIAFSVASFAQRTISVDNNPNSPARYKSFQAAVDSAMPGDIIMLHGSGVSYGNAIISKKIVVVGPGYFLSENSDTQANLYSARFEQITVKDGADGSLLTGLEVTDFMRVQCDNAQITRNRLRHIVLDGANNAYVIQNFVYEKGLRIENGCGSLFIANNFLNGNSTGFASITNASGDMTAMIFNNILTFGLEVKNSTVKNNILMNGELFNSLGNNYMNNVSNKLQFGTANGNKGNVDVYKLFDGSQPSTDAKWQLVSSSAASGVGEGNTDCGIFGGNTPYVLSGLPFVPSISKIEAAGSATSGGGLRVTIKAKTNP